ncbi:MAG: DUF1573 domain-containing protein [Rikenellaceae bacterium]
MAKLISTYRLLALCALLLGVQYAQGQRPTFTREELDQISNPTLAEGSEVLYTQSLHYDLGSVSEDGGVVEGSFNFENRGAEALIILRATADCGCLKLKYPTAPILPGQSFEVEFTYNPKGYPGRLSRRVLLYTNLSQSAPTAKMSVGGYVESSSDMSGRFPHAKGVALLKGEEILFRGVSNRQVERILAYNSGENELNIRALAGSLPSGVTLSTQPSTVTAHQQFDIVVTLDPSMWKGQARDFKIFLDGVGASPLNSVIEIKFR